VSNSGTAEDADHFLTSWRYVVQAYLFWLQSVQTTIIPFPCPFSVLAKAMFIYHTSVPTGTEARTELK